MKNCDTGEGLSLGLTHFVRAEQCLSTLPGCMIWLDPR
jgi:hypothetical protein